MYRLGVVSFLNSRPLIEGLEGRCDVQLVLDVPSRLAERLERGEVDAALVPLVDVLRSAGRLRVVSDACIACDGETMTVRVFSQTPPDRIRTLWVDGDSHTSIALAAVLWRELYDRALELRPLSEALRSARGGVVQGSALRTSPAAETQSGASHCGAGSMQTQSRALHCGAGATQMQSGALHYAAPVAYGGLVSVLLIGDKVVSAHRGGFAYEVDLGAAWRQHTELPFVFAVWAACERSRFSVQGSAGGTAVSAGRSHEDASSRGHEAALAGLLSDARDRGVARAAEIAEVEGPKRWWPAALAKRYLTQCLKFRLDARYIEGANLFARLCARYGLAAADAEIIWPDDLLAGAVSDRDAMNARPGRSGL